MPPHGLTGKISIVGRRRAARTFLHSSFYILTGLRKLLVAETVLKCTLHLGIPRFESVVLASGFHHAAQCKGLLAAAHEIFHLTYAEAVVRTFGCCLNPLETFCKHTRHAEIQL